MKTVLLDENLPRRLKTVLAGFDIRTVGEAGWPGEENGELLRLAASRSDVFLTADSGIPFPQNLGVLPLGVVLLSVGSIKFRDLAAIAPAIQDAVAAVRPGELRVISRSE